MQERKLSWRCWVSNSEPNSKLSKMQWTLNVTRRCLMPRQSLDRDKIRPSRSSTPILTRSVETNSKSKKRPWRASAQARKPSSSRLWSRNVQRTLKPVRQHWKLGMLRRLNSILRLWANNTEVLRIGSVLLWPGNARLRKSNSLLICGRNALGRQLDSRPLWPKSMQQRLTNWQLLSTMKVQKIKQS